MAERFYEKAASCGLDDADITAVTELHRGPATAVLRWCVAMHVMDEAEYHRFLTEGTRTGKLATTRSDGRPHVAPVGFDLDDDGTIFLTTGANSVKGKNLQRDPRVCLCVDNQTPPYSFVIIDGIAEITEDPGLLLEWATRIAGRYMGAEKAEQYGRRNAMPGELLVRITPNHVVAQADIAD